MEDLKETPYGKRVTNLHVLTTDELSTPPGTPSGASRPSLSTENAFPNKFAESYRSSLVGEKKAEKVVDSGDVKDMFVSLYNQRASTPVAWILGAAALGVGLGAILSHLKVDGDWALWIALPGELFVNALKCLISPMVFCSIVSCIGQLVQAGKAASIGGRIMGYFAICSIISSAMGVIFGVLFSPFFIEQMNAVDGAEETILRVHCANSSSTSAGDHVLTMTSDGGMRCAMLTNGTDSTALLTLNDHNNIFVGSTDELETLSVSQQIFSILQDIVPENLVQSFASASTMSVITLAIVFGVAVVKSHDRTKQQLGVNAATGLGKPDERGENHLLLLINHAGLVCQLLINAVVKLIPFAVVSMVAGSMAQYSSSVDLVESVGFLVLALALALLTLTLGIMGGALFVVTRRNVFSYLRHMVPAQVFIFGCSSSMATLPMTMRCVDATREVSYALSRFLLPLGATSNLNGSACYMTLACIFMAKVGGYGEMLTPVRYALLTLVGAIASFGVAPVPHSGLVMAITVWRTVFNMDVPAVFSLLVGTDWILNRMRAIVNITNDTILLRIIADQCDETTISELELEEQPTTAC